MKAKKPPKLTEKQFQAQVCKLAQMLGWRIYHTYDSRRSQPGFPDLVLVHRGKQRVIFAELKTSTGKLSIHQKLWLQELAAVASVAESVEVCVWRPENWPEIEQQLSRIA